jgi:hypothetical protein
MLRSEWLIVVSRPSPETAETAYFDEAGIHAQAPIIVVAGYLARKKDWDWLEEKWNDALKGVDCYHTTDIEHDPLSNLYKGWTRKEVDELTDRIVPIAAKFKGQAYGVHMAASTWHAAVPFVKTYLPTQPHSIPYMVLAKRAIEVILYSRGSHQKDQIGFVFARNDWRQDLLDGYDILKKIHERRALMGPIAVDDMQDNPMLQAADFISWHYRRVTEIRKGFAKPPLHRAVKQIFTPKRHDQFHYVPEKEFVAEIASFYREHGAEWNQQVMADMIEREKRRQERKERGEIRKRDSRSK